MKMHHSLALILLLSIGAAAQSPKKTAPPAAPSQAQINKMMIDAIKQTNIFNMDARK